MVTKPKRVYSKIKTVVKRIMYHNPKTNWGVLSVKNTLPNDPFFKEKTLILTGVFTDVYVNCEIEYSGEFALHNKYGNQISLTFLKVSRDLTKKDAIIRFLMKSIDGIFVQHAEKIYETFGKDSIDIVLNHPERLKEIHGIGEGTYNKVLESIQEYKKMEDLINYCANIGIPYNLMVRLTKNMEPDEALKLLKEDIYSILNKGEYSITFKAIDDVALKTGIKHDDPRRLKACLSDCIINKVVMNSSTGCTINDLQRDFSKGTGISDVRTFNATLNGLNKDGLVVMEGSKVFYGVFYKKEKFIAEALTNMMNTPVPYMFSDEDYEDAMGIFPFELNEGQKSTIRNVLNSRVAVLSGGPGCVDGDTEYFNGISWKPIREYTPSEKVLQYNKDGSAELVVPLRYVREKADLYHMQNSTGSINQVLSDNHRFIYVTSKGNIAEKPFKEIRKSIEEKGGRNATSIITHFTYNTVDTSNLTPDQLRLMIAISADGSLSQSKNFWRVRLKKTCKINRLKELLQRLNLNITEHIYADGYSNFNIPFQYGCKEFPASFYSLTGELLDTFCEEIFLWDGSLKSGKRDVQSYFTTVKKNADIAQFLLSQKGTRVSIYADDRRGQIKKDGKYTYNSICYQVSKTKTVYIGLKNRVNRPPITVAPYKPQDGLQYCFTVPSGMLVLRRANNIFITGNCGKSTITKALVHLLKRNNIPFKLLSPTGKATRRMEECIGEKAQTIHKYLRVKKSIEDAAMPEVVQRNTVYLIDESSMVDILMLAKLLELSTTYPISIVFIGDRDQLPSVQAGDVLADMIASKKVPLFMLTDIMRQAQDSHIIKYCADINNGKKLKECKFDDFVYEEYYDEADLINDIQDIYMKEVKEKGLLDVQVIAPYKRGLLGVNQLNDELSNYYNDNEYNESTGFKLGDKVMQVVNDYQKNVFNGEVGIITALTDDKVTISFTDSDNEVVYQKDDLPNITQAYACTCHKSQGAEYSTVIVVLDSECGNFLLNRKLLYTATSRGKKKVYILSKPHCLETCINNTYEIPRITKLKDFLIANN